jgi:hypothetical protein
MTTGDFRNVILKECKRLKNLTAFSLRIAETPPHPRTNSYARLPPDDAMEPVKVVARYIDGKRVKGFSQDFFPNKDRFHIYPAEKPSAEAVEVLVNELKVIFFVLDFIGNFQYDEWKNYLEGEKPL